MLRSIQNFKKDEQSKIYTKMMDERNVPVNKEKILPAYREKKVDFFFVHRETNDPVYIQMLDIDAISGINLSKIGANQP